MAGTTQPYWSFTRPAGAGGSAARVLGTSVRIHATLPLKAREVVNLGLPFAAGREGVTSPPSGRNCDVAIALDVLGHSDDFEGTGCVVLDLSSRWKDGARNISRLFLRVVRVRANPVCSRASSAARIRVLLARGERSPQRPLCQDSPLEAEALLMCVAAVGRSHYSPPTSARR
jgi:hypothetical protein